ncbi:hypothetical protein BRADO6550 [Bradyrhizobium sp. ORS 278]|nr:hypothetical protein [Bradyrhizobium sp. ORS 278]CAL80158.1 hypothetical protein BRADO6550 [Bradyrhizobium sp. ORS 278]
MADTEFSHNISQQIWDEFGPQLEKLGFSKSDFGFVDNYRMPGTT